MKKSSLNILTEFSQNDTVLFEDAGVQITFTGAGTATMDNDDVISDAQFIFKSNNRFNKLVIESTNGQPGTLTVENFLITLEFADGYSQSCGLRLEIL